MSVYQSCLLLLVATVLGWLIHSAFLKFLFWPHMPMKFLGIGVCGVLPAKLPALSKFVAQNIAQGNLVEKIVDQKPEYDSLAIQLKPKIEVHVDEFLKDRLPQAFPMLFNLMGEKTLLKFKALFMDELQNVLPMVMKDAVNSAVNQLDLLTVVEKAAREMPIKVLEKSFRKHAAADIIRFKWCGAAAGFLLGLIQLAILTVLT